ncbi:polysaccharide lyase family 7 protein [Caminibacter mediatlanticus TB-2]|uniref:Polysaccharide lyase family 7 protein n=1 Tax=Caminibacter mediatlanticus TB-2 TaxID=391592 RepID=A0ABX5VDN2_9BACT|nr:polysaccharide lyase family 7 protein [Caminibacter mediatlanticus]QCT95241.1 polysaccharide lyase family 7 protein [Caminibacter mediatlanticus TB-2]
MILRGISFFIFFVILFGHDSPYSLDKFKPVLNMSKLQAPKSSFNPLYSRHYGDFKDYSNKYFYLQDNKYMVFYMCGSHNRSELRFKNIWSVNTKIPKILEAEVKLFSLNAKREFTFLQIHADSTLKDAPIINKPLLRIVWRKEYHNLYNHLWAIIRISDSLLSNNYKKIDLGILQKDFFNVKIIVVKNMLKIYLNNKLKVKENVSYWQKYKNYFKAGVYLQDKGCAKVLFNRLFIKE